MKRTVLETALVMMVLVLGLEVVHYRNAVLEANVDRKTAWRTVVELRRKCEPAAQGAPSNPVPGQGAPSHATVPPAQGAPSHRAAPAAPAEAGVQR
jgi:hypothetical protein